jgi:hypothetical protein
MREPPMLDGLPLPRFPCADNKAPLTPHGHKDATTVPRDERGWPLTGVVAGVISGMFVLDVDPKSSGDRWLAANRQPPYDAAPSHAQRRQALALSLAARH